MFYNLPIIWMTKKNKINFFKENIKFLGNTLYALNSKKYFY
jgi:hypothetical protein